MDREINFIQKTNDFHFTKKEGPYAKSLKEQFSKSKSANVMAKFLYKRT